MESYETKGRRHFGEAQPRVKMPQSLFHHICSREGVVLSGSPLSPFSVVDIAFLDSQARRLIEKTPLTWVLQTGLRTDNQHTR
jgi:hypothetical protein